MSLTLTSFSDGTTVSATDVNARIASTELYINEQIASGDLQTSSGWVTSTHLYPPDFYGSPHPRVEAQSFDVFHRATLCPEPSGDFNWTILHSDTAPDVYAPVPGLCTKVWIEDNSTWVTYLVSFFAFAQASSDTIAASTEGNLAATFKLYVDGAAVTGTERKVYDNSAQHFPRKQVSMVVGTTLNKGLHDVGVRININTTQIVRNTVQSIYIQPRNLIVLADTR